MSTEFVAIQLLKIITVGDETYHGGTMISGSPDHDIRGKAIARLGVKVKFPMPYAGAKPHGVNKINTAKTHSHSTECPLRSKDARQNAGAS